MQALSDEQQMERLEKKVDDGFAEMRAEFKAVKTEVRDEFKAARAEQSALVRTLIQIIGGSCAALSSGFLALIVTHL